MKELIAIVDDEPDILKRVSLHLEKAGFRVEGFLDAENYFTFIDSKIPDLIILDLMLPDTDGFELCKYLKKKDEKNKNRLFSYSLFSLELLDEFSVLVIDIDDEWHISGKSVSSASMAGIVRPESHLSHV